MPKTATRRSTHGTADQARARRSGPATDILDRKALDAIREMESPSMPDVLEQIVDVYLEHAEKQLSVLVAAIAESDVTPQNRIAHTLKSSSANLGARDLADLCQLLETSTLHGPAANAGELSASIIDNFAKVRTALLVELGRT